MKEKLINVIDDVTEGAYSTEEILKEDYEKKGMLHSLQIVELVVKLENEFDIEIDDEDLSMENMKSFDSIMNLVNRLQNRQKFLWIMK